MGPSILLGAISSLLLLQGSASTGEDTTLKLNIGDCDDLETAVSYTSTTRVNAKLTSTYISCPSWTSFEIKENRLKLVAGGDLTDEDEVTFYNVRFVVSSELRVEIPLRFNNDIPAAGDASREVNGGVFYVGEGARAEFISDVYIDEGRVDTGVTDPADVTPDAGRGGCFYNEGRLKFRGSLTTKGCRTTSLAQYSGGNLFGDGGTIWNGENGRLTVKGELDLECATVFENDGISRGGAIYNAGKVDFYQNASFTEGCYAQTGGIIYNEGRVRFYEDSFAFFSFSYTPGDGGHIFNSGNMFFLGGANHELGNTDLSGGGIYNEGKAIYSPGTSVRFSMCGSDEFGGAIALTVDSTFDLPEDTVFDANYILNPVDENVDQCDDIYLETSSGYTCLTSWPPE